MKTKRIPWIFSGRDRRLKKGDLDLQLYDLAQGDQAQYLYLFGRALKSEILRTWPTEEHLDRKLVCPKDVLAERCLNFILSKPLWVLGVTTDSLCRRAVANFIASYGGNIGTAAKS